MSMEPSIRLSVIIPTRDRREMVCRALDSVLVQTRTPDEIIVVDDGSLDGTSATIRRSYPQVRLVTTAGIGPGPARHAGVRASTGSHLFFLDADDLWTRDHLDRLAALLENKTAAVYGITQTLDTRRNRVFEIPETGQAAEGDCFAALGRWCFLVPSACAVSRTAYDRVGGFGNEPLGEDWCFFLRLAHRYSFGFCPARITMRLLHPGSCCCRTDVGSAIPSLVARIRHLVEVLRPEEMELLDFLHIHEQFISREYHQWLTVQDWYLSLHRHRLL